MNSRIKRVHVREDFSETFQNKAFYNLFNKWLLFSINPHPFMSLPFCLHQFLMADCQLLLGTMSYRLDPEEYITAALTIYLDIVLIFLYLLGRRWNFLHDIHVHKLHATKTPYYTTIKTSFIMYILKLHPVFKSPRINEIWQKLIFVTCIYLFHTASIRRHFSECFRY